MDLCYVLGGCLSTCPVLHGPPNQLWGKPQRSDTPSIVIMTGYLFASRLGPLISQTRDKKINKNKTFQHVSQHGQFLS